MLDERADQVIGLVPRAAPLHDAQRSRIAAALLELPLELWRRGVPVRLVLRVDLGTKRRRQALVEEHGDMLGIDLLDEVAEEPAVAVQRVDRVPVPIDHIVGHRIVGPEHVHAGVDEVLHCAEL